VAEREVPKSSFKEARAGRDVCFGSLQRSAAVLKFHVAELECFSPQTRERAARACRVEFRPKPRPLFHSPTSRLRRKRPFRISSSGRPCWAFDPAPRVTAAVLLGHALFNGGGGT